MIIQKIIILFLALLLAIKNCNGEIKFRSLLTTDRTSTPYDPAYGAIIEDSDDDNQDSQDTHQNADTNQQTDGMLPPRNDPKFKLGKSMF